MKKLLLALPLFAGAAWAGTTAYSGAQTEPAYKLLLEQMDSKMFSVTPKDFDGGFMNSEAVTEVRSKEKPDSEPLFLLNHTINHSPVSMVPETARFGAANIITTLDINSVKDEELKKILQAFDTGAPFVVNTDISIDGDSNSKITLNSIDHSDKNGNFKADKSVYEINTTMDGLISGNGNLNNIQILNNKNGGEVALNGASLNFDIKRVKAGSTVQSLFGDAKIEFNMDEMNIVEAGRPLASLTGARLEMEQQFSDEDPVVNFGIGAQSVESEELPIKSFDFNTALNGFSVEKMKSHTAFLVRLQNAADPAEVLLSPEGLDMIRSTFTPGTKLALDLKADSTEGDTDGDVSIWFTGNDSDDGYTGMETVGDLAKAIAGTANIELDRSLLALSPMGQMLDDPIAQAYLTITDDKVILKANLDKLVLQLNDQMLPLELMGGEILQMPLEFLTQM